MRAKIGVRLNGAILSKLGVCIQITLLQALLRLFENLEVEQMKFRELFRVYFLYCLNCCTFCLKQKKQEKRDKSRL